MLTRRWSKAVVGGLIIMVLALLLATVPACQPAAGKIGLIAATWEGTEGSTIPPLKAWIEELGSKSGGQVQVEIAYGSVMGPPPKHYDLAVTGEADISHVGLPYTPGRFPMVEVIEMPITKISELTLAKAYWELYQKGYFDNDFKDVKVLYLSVVGPYDYQMGKKAVLTFEDMKGMKMRASGKNHTAIVKALGSVPQGMPAPEIYGSLEKGVIDGSFTPWSFMKAFRTEAVTKHVTEVGAGGFGHAYIMMILKQPILMK